jgi:hypothetical protein
MNRKWNKRMYSKKQLMNGRGNGWTDDEFMYGWMNTGLKLLASGGLQVTITGSVKF